MPHSLSIRVGVPIGNPTPFCFYPVLTVVAARRRLLGAACSQDHIIVLFPRVTGRHQHSVSITSYPPQLQTISALPAMLVPNS